MEELFNISKYIKYSRYQNQSSYSQKRARDNSALNRKIASIVVNLLVLLANILILAKRAAFFFSSAFIIVPGKKLAKVIFYKILVPFYVRNLSTIKKINWQKKYGTAYTFVINQRTIHFLVVAMTLFIVVYNFAGQSQAKAFTNVGTGNQTIIGSLIGSEFGTDEEAQLIEEFFDEQQTITPEEQHYLESLSLQNKNAVDVTNPDETEETQDLMTIEDNTALVKVDTVLTQKTKRPRESTVYYAVESGDTVSSIAEKFEISISSILWENNLTAYSMIRPGDQLAILPMSGIMHKVEKGQTLTKIAKLYGIDEDTITEVNKLSGSLAAGIKILIPGGRKLYSGEVVPRRTIAQGSNSSSGQASVGKRSADSAPASGKMNWPTVGYRITQYYTWRHHAIDIANKVGTPLFAADGGVIEQIGWGTGYGNQIVINHGKGKLTRYAHMSKFYVKKGQYVKKGEAIGEMGNTGWSTGPHIHFEIIINGVKYNPLNYIK